MKMRLFLLAGVKGVCKILHNFIPLSYESLLKKQFNKIFCSTIFILCHHKGFLGCARVIFLKRDKLDTQLAILKPRRGHTIPGSLSLTSEGLGFEGA
jgi:hypothetical protein